MQRILVILALLSALVFTALAISMQRSDQMPAELADATVLEWSDLVPSVEPLADALAEIPINVRYDLGFIAKVLEDADAGVISRKGPEYLNAIQLLEKYRADELDVDRMLAAVSGRDKEIERRGENVNTSLDGVLVRLPGYALPLQTVDRGVTEFLLVPFVGACIHVPPPPPNQVVLAQLDSPYRVKDLFDPVLITGHLKAQPASSELYLVDGQAQVPMGYSMQVVHVEPME